MRKVKVIKMGAVGEILIFSQNWMGGMHVDPKP